MRFDPSLRPAPSRPALVGLGLKSAHLPALLERRAGAADEPLGFLEVHAENWMIAGGPRLRQLDRIRERWPLSVHGVGLSLGGTDPLDEAHLDRLAEVVARVEPVWVSEHLAWSVHRGRFLNDLLPVRYDEAALVRIAARIDRVQSRLGRRVLIENPSTYLAFPRATMDEGAFLRELVRRTGCGLLLDVTNAYVSGVNHARDPWALIEALPESAVAQVHLAGFAEDTDAAGSRLLVDHHGAPVDDAVWALYARTLARLGPVPTLIERDHHVPPIEALEAEARRALQTLREAVDA